MNPRSEALAYRIWAYCNPRGWGLTYAEVAEELGESIQRIVALSHRREWSDRFKSTSNWETFVAANVSRKPVALSTAYSVTPDRTMDTPRRYLADEVVE